MATHRRMNAFLARRLTATLITITSLLVMFYCRPLFSSNAQHEALEQFSLGVFPYLPLGRLYTIFRPVADDLSDHLGKTVTLYTQSDFATFRAKLEHGDYDFAYVQPFDYIAAHDKQGYIPLARLAEDLTAIIAVRSDSELTSLDDLRGKHLTLPPHTAAATRVVLRMLQDANIDPAKDLQILESRNHFSCLDKVLTRKAEGCTTTQRALDLWARTKSDDAFRVLAKAKPIPHVLYVAHPRVTEKTRDLVRATILDWPNTAIGRMIIEIGPATNFVAARDTDYDQIRALLKPRQAPAVMAK
jgi:phosphonate transport system substrate-binding protein